MSITPGAAPAPGLAAGIRGRAAGPHATPGFIPDTIFAADERVECDSAHHAFSRPMRRPRSSNAARKSRAWPRQRLHALSRLGARTRPWRRSFRQLAKTFPAGCHAIRYGTSDPAAPYGAPLWLCKLVQT